VEKHVRQRSFRFSPAAARCAASCGIGGHGGIDISRRPDRRQNAIYTIISSLLIFPPVVPRYSYSRSRKNDDDREAQRRPPWLSRCRADCCHAARALAPTGVQSTKLKSSSRSVLLQARPH